MLVLLCARRVGITPTMEDVGKLSYYVVHLKPDQMRIIRDGRKKPMIEVEAVAAVR